MSAAAHRRDNRVFHYAVLFSIVLHGFVLLAAPGLRDSSRRQAVPPGPLVARLVQPSTSAAPAPVPSQPEPVKPRAEEPPPVAKPTPAPKGAPAPKAQPKPSKPAPVTPAQPSAETASSETRAETGAPAAQSGAQAKVEQTPSAPAGGAERDAENIKLLIGRYGIGLKGEMAKQIKYPMIARQEGWKGKGELLLRIGSNGMIAEIQIVRTSGYPVLDNAVVEGLRRAKPWVQIPTGLRGRAFSIEIPFEMNLTNP